MKKLLILIFIAFGLIVNAQVPAKPDSAIQRIKVLEQSLADTRKELIATQNLVNLANERSIETKDKALKIGRELWTEEFGWMAGALTFISAVLGLFIGWLGLRKLLEHQANKIFSGYLTNRLKDLKEQDIMQLFEEIDSASWKAQIRKKKVLVLNQNDTILPADFEMALKVFKPEIKDIKEPKDAFKLKFDDYSLVVLENFEDVGYWKLEDYTDDLVKLADKICGNDAAFIYYGKSRDRFPETKVNKHLVNYANSPSQLYNNVMNTLKFQDLLSKHS